MSKVHLLIDDALESLLKFKNDDDEYVKYGEIIHLLLDTRLNSGRVWLIGNGIAAHSIQLFKYLWEDAGINIKTFTDIVRFTRFIGSRDEIYVELLKSSSVKKEDVLFIVTTDLNDKSLIQAAKWASENNVKILAITKNEDSLLSQYSTHTLKIPTTTATIDYVFPIFGCAIQQSLLSYKVNYGD